MFGLSCCIFKAALAPIMLSFSGHENVASDAVTFGNGQTYLIIDR